MESSCNDLEFFDFNNATEEEIKEVQAILKNTGCNGSVELPWEIPVGNVVVEPVAKKEGDEEEKTEPEVLCKNSKSVGAVVGQALLYANTNPSSPPVARLPPPPEEVFVPPPPTTLSHYASTPYFVSRTIPFLRAYPHMGMPFFACPLPGANETSPMPSPYGQFVSMVPVTVAQDKSFIGHVDSESSQKCRVPADRQFNRRSKKKSSLSLEYCTNYESEGFVDVYRDPALIDEQLSVCSPISSTASSDRPTTVPLVPLPVQPSSFGVAGGTIPLHGYPPGLHTLPYTQLSGHQAPSAAMYYVPVFNHPYGSYITSPSAPVVLPVNLRPETELNSEDCNGDAFKNVSASPTSVDNVTNVQPNFRVSPSHVSCDESTGAEVASVDSTVDKHSVSDMKETDCDSIKSVSSSPDSYSATVTTTAECCKSQLTDEEMKEASHDGSRCWADLFKNSCSEVNGIDRQLSAEQENGKTGKDIVNGKLYSVPDSDIERH